MTHPAPTISGHTPAVEKNRRVVQAQDARSLKEERVSNTNSPFLLGNQISTETGKARKDGFRPPYEASLHSLIISLLELWDALSKAVHLNPLWTGYDSCLLITASGMCL